MSLADRIAAVLCMTTEPVPLDELARYGAEADVLAALDELHHAGRMVCVPDRVAYVATAAERAANALPLCRAALEVLQAQLGGVGRTLAEIERLLSEDRR